MYTAQNICVYKLTGTLVRAWCSTLSIRDGSGIPYTCMHVAMHARLGVHDDRPLFGSRRQRCVCTCEDLARDKEVETEAEGVKVECASKRV